MGCGSSKPPVSQDGGGPAAGDRKNRQDEKKKGTPTTPAEKEHSSASSAVKDQPLGNNGKLLDKYTLGKVLGQGAFGVVYKCHKKGKDEEFAVKMIDQVETPLQDIKREAHMLNKLEHPSVIKLWDVFYEKVFVCMVLDYYRGGDMIQGMMAHWKTKGMIPISSVKGLSKQMHSACAWVHQNGCVHRDVKGDNFMMEKPNVETSKQRLYLSDFGTVIEIAPGERCNQKCGTKNYWPPEFFALRYGQKVDCWAVGVVMFGLVSGKFPFKGEDDVKTKRLVVPKRCPEDGQALINALLERKEDKRMSCAEAENHTFLSDQPAPPIADMNASQEDQGFVTDIKETGANAGIAQRRAELVERLQKAEEGPKSKSKQEKGYQKAYGVLDPASERTTVFRWTSASQVSGMVAAFDRAKPVAVGELVNREVTESSVRQMLLDHNVDIAGFGTGKARKFHEFVSEIQNGSSRLLLDATKHKCVVRAVSMVLMRISVGSGSAKKFLVTSRSLPGSGQYPQENALQTAERLRSELLGIGDGQITWDASLAEAFEETQESPLYPGIQTVYRKEIMDGTLATTDESVLRQLGLQGENKFVCNVGGVTHAYDWLEEKDCLKAGITLRAKKDQDFSALVYPPIGLEEEELHEFLNLNKIDTSKWGQGTYKTLADFSEELVKGESTLIKLSNGQIARVVDIVVLHLTRKDTNEVLTEEKETFRDAVTELNRLPAIKRRSDEHQFYTARRMVTKHLKLDENKVEIATQVQIIEEEQDSKSWPALKSIYRKRFIKGVLDPE